MEITFTNLLGYEFVPGRGTKNVPAKLSIGLHDSMKAFLVYQMQSDIDNSISGESIIGSESSEWLGIKAYDNATRAWWIAAFSVILTIALFFIK